MSEPSNADKKNSEGLIRFYVQLGRPIRMQNNPQSPLILTQNSPLTHFEIVWCSPFFIGNRFYLLSFNRLTPLCP